MRLDNQILSELSTRKDLSPHDREAFPLVLEYRDHCKHYNSNSLLSFI